MIIPTELLREWEDDLFDSKKWKSFSQLCYAFRMILSAEKPLGVHGGKIICVIDAVDECNPGRERQILVNTLERLVEKSSQKSMLGGIIVTSRSYPDIRFPSAGNRLLDLNLEDAVDRDLEAYIDAGLKNLIQRRPPLERYAGKIREKLVSRAEKMFLLVELLFELLNRLHDSSARSMDATLDSLPSTLEEIYDRLWLETIQKGGDRARRIFSWILVSFRPLSFEEYSMLVGRMDFDAEMQARQRNNEPCDTNWIGSKYRISISGKKYNNQSSPEGARLKGSDYKALLDSAAALDAYTPMDIEGDLQAGR